MRDHPPAYRFVIRWPVARDDLPGVAARLVRELHGHAAGILICNLTAAHATVASDAVTVDTLARLAVAARRCGWTLRVDDVPAELAGLIAMIGLAPVLLPGEPPAPDVRQP